MAHEPADDVSSTEKCGTECSHGPGHENEHQHAGGCCGHDHDHGHTHDHGPGAGKAKLSPFFYLELLVLVLWGAVLIAFMVNGRVVNFLTPTGILREQTFIGGFVLLVMAVFNFLMRHKTCDCGHEHHHHGAEGEGGAQDHGHHHHEEAGWASRLVTLILLAAPVGYAWASVPDGYSAELQTAMANSVSAQVNTGGPTMPKIKDLNGEYTIATFRRQLGVSEEGPIPLDTQSFFYNGGDPDMRKILDGQPFEITGRVVKNTIGTKKNRLRMYDLQVTCCSADARPFSFPLQFSGDVPEYIERGWYKVRGKAAFEEERGSMVSMLVVEEMTATTRPASQGRAY